MQRQGPLDLARALPQILTPATEGTPLAAPAACHRLDRATGYGTHKTVKAIYQAVKAIHKTVKACYDTYKTVKARVWHIQDSGGQMLATATEGTPLAAPAACHRLDLATGCSASCTPVKARL